MQITIIGAPRSGTTLFAAMIGSHPEVSILNEDKTGAWRRALGRPNLGVKLCVPNQTERSPAARDVARRRLEPEIAQRLGGFAAWDLGKSQAWHEPFAGETLDDFLATAGEEARVLATLRSPERVVGSIQKRGGQPLGEALYRWLRTVEILHELSEAAPERVALVAFERLVSAPEPVLRACADWLGLAFHPAMLTADTPFYGMSEIDAEKAGTADNAFRTTLAQSFPAQWQAYAMLRNGALGGA